MARKRTSTTMRIQLNRPDDPAGSRAPRPSNGVIGDRALNMLLDQLDTAPDLTAKRDMLRRWVEAACSAEPESAEQEYERLGKLGGG